MRIKMASVLLVFLPLIYSPRPAAAQFNPTLPPMPQAFAHKLRVTGKHLELQSDADSPSVRSNTDLANKLRTFLEQRNPEQRRYASSIGIQPTIDTSRCAHIDVIPAPDMDSKMIKEIPKEFASNMPTWQGLQSCCGDFLGITVIPRASPLVNPGQVGDILLKPGTVVLRPRPQ